jgi:hypothetical protein
MRICENGQYRDMTPAELQNVQNDGAVPHLPTLEERLEKLETLHKQFEKRLQALFQF